MLTIVPLTSKQRKLSFECLSFPEEMLEVPNPFEGKTNVNLASFVLTNSTKESSESDIQENTEMQCFEEVHEE